MSRLIDAGLLLDNLSGRLESMKDYDAIKDVVKNMPTAYDPDKVADQLEELKAIKDGGIPIIHGQEELKLHDREIRNKAVDDFANRLYSKIKSEIDDCADELEWIDEIAKQLKAGDCD